MAIEIKLGGGSRRCLIFIKAPIAKGHPNEYKNMLK